MAEPRDRPYHHGDLRVALLEAAAAEIAESGVAGASLRRIAARAGVSHTAAGHHFGDKAGLLTALAADGHRRLAAALAHGGGDLLAQGLAYVRFAAQHPAHFEVMFHPDLLHVEDPDLVAARQASFAPLVSASGDTRPAAYAAWSFVHGVATLHATGNLPGDLGDLEAAFTTLARGTRFGQT